eukprot:9202352-Pyramimonas_sp.AAC.1
MSVCFTEPGSTFAVIYLGLVLCGCPGPSCRERWRKKGLTHVAVQVSSVPITVGLDIWSAVPSAAGTFG